MDTKSDFYIASNKIDWIKMLTSLLFAWPAAMMVGYLYAWATNADYVSLQTLFINFFAIFLAVLAVLIICIIALYYSCSRNRNLNIILALITGIMAWYGNWVYFVVQSGPDFLPHILSPLQMAAFILKFGDTRHIVTGHAHNYMTMQGAAVAYVVELVVFLFPAYAISRDQFYYCEDCNTQYTVSNFYSAEVARVKAYVAQSAPGSFKFLNDLKLVSTYKQLNLQIALQPEVVEFRYCYCEKCRSRDIMDISTYTLRLMRGGVPTEMLTRELPLVKGVYISDETHTIMQQKMANTKLPYNPLHLSDIKKDIIDFHHRGWALAPKLQRLVIIISCIVVMLAGGLLFNPADGFIYAVIILYGFITFKAFYKG